MKNVIDTAVVASGIVNSMNAQSGQALLKQISLAAQNSDDAVEQRLGNQLTQLSTDVDNRFLQTNQRMDQIENLANMLSGDETTQIEAILRQLIDSPRMQALFDGMCVTVGGNSYNAKSLIAALASMDKLASTTITRDENEAVNGCHMTLTDGVVIAFAAAIVDDAEAGLRTVTFTADWKGVPAEFVQTMVIKKETIQRFGTDFEAVEYQLKSSGNVVLNLTADACVATADPVPDVDGDGDNDGIAPNA